MKHIQNVVAVYIKYIILQYTYAYDAKEGKK